MLRKATKEYVSPAESFSAGLKIRTEPSLPEVDSRWTEFRIRGKNILGRSQHVGVIEDNWLYIHGGTNADVGILSDFHRINLSAKEFTWERLKQDLTEYPGKLKGHSAVVHEHNLYIYGGQPTDDSASNVTYRYSFAKGFWKMIPPTKDTPKLESHNAVVYGDAMYVLNGYSTEQGQLSSKIYQLDLKQYRWSLCYQPTAKEKSPAARSCSSVTLIGNDIWMFGGRDQNSTLNDLWRFDIRQRKWIEVLANNAPLPRRSCSLLSYRDHLILFGGIQDVTKQLNDVYAYDISQNHWSKIHSNSNSIYECSPTLKRSSELKKKKEGSLLKKQSMLYQRTPISPEKTTDAMKRIFFENKLKKFEQRKRQLLKDFQKDKTEPPVERKLSPTTENLIKTLKSLGDQSNNRIVVAHEIRFDSSNRFIVGKKPCARDAHTALLYGTQMLLFGGDRHLMCFNDVYYFDLDKGIESKSLYERAGS